MVKTNKYLFNCNLEKSIAYFFLMENYINIHPYIHSISKEDKDGFHSVIEKPFPKIPLKVRYKLKPEKIKNKVTFKVKGLVFLKPEITYLFEKKEKETQLTVKIKVKGIPLATHFFAYKVRKGVDLIMEAINNSN